MIDSGIPQDADGWPDGVLIQLAAWEQGDVVAEPRLFYFADPEVPIWEGTKAYTADSVGPEIVEAPESHAPPFGLVTSQTCDVGEIDRKRPVRPWVQVAPIYLVTDGGWKKKVPKGGGPRYWLYVPLLPDGVWVADLRIEMPVEKGWLARQERVQGFPDEEGKARVGRRVAWIRSRPAFSDAFNASVFDPLHARLDGIEESDEIGLDAMEAIDEVAVRVDSASQPTVAQVTFLTKRALNPAEREWLETWRDDQEDAAKQVGINLLALDIRSLGEVTVAEYRQMLPMWS